MGASESRGRILVVEDDKFVLRVIERYLGPHGYDITHAGSVDEAWALLEGAGERQPFDALLLDRHLPGKNGLELLEHMKEVPCFREIPVVVQTAATRPEEVAEGIAKGAFYYLPKPFTQDVLLAIVGAAVARFRSRLDLRGRINELSHGVGLLRRMEFGFRELDDVQPLASYLALHYPEPERVVTGIAEFLLNAVEHGNLEVTYRDKSELLRESGWEQEVRRRLSVPPYRDRQVEAVLAFADDDLILTIRDEGPGFDWQRYLEFSPERAFDAHGRGIAMSRLFSFDEVEYRGRGNEVVLTVRREPFCAS